MKKAVLFFILILYFCGLSAQNNSRINLQIDLQSDYSDNPNTEVPYWVVAKRVKVDYDIYNEKSDAFSTSFKVGASAIDYYSLYTELGMMVESHHQDDVPQFFFASAMGVDLIYLDMITYNTWGNPEAGVVVYNRTEAGVRFFDRVRVSAFIQPSFISYKSNNWIWGLSIKARLWEQ